MSLATYGDLKTAVANWAARTDLTSRLPEFVQLAETRMNRDLARIAAGEIVTTSALTTTAEAIDLPADFNGMRFLAINGANTKELIYKTPPQLYGEFVSSAVGEPKAYTIHGKDGVSDVLQARFRPIPDSAYALLAYYYKKVATLVGGADGGTNWMLTNNPDCYMYATSFEAAVFMENDTAVAKFKALYEQALNDVKKLDEARRAAGISPRGRMSSRLIRGC